MQREEYTQAILSVSCFYFMTQSPQSDNIKVLSSKMPHPLYAPSAKGMQGNLPKCRVVIKGVDLHEEEKKQDLRSSQKA